MSWRVAAALCGLLSPLCAPVALAERPGKPAGTITVLRQVGEGDEHLLARVRGQLSDLDVRLQATRQPQPPADFGAQLERAHQLAEHTGAQVIIWFSRPEPALLLMHVATADGARALTRRLRAQVRDNTDALDSASLEAAAVAARSAVRAVLHAPPDQAQPPAMTPNRSGSPREAGTVSGRPKDSTPEAPPGARARRAPEVRPRTPSQDTQTGEPRDGDDWVGDPEPAGTTSVGLQGAIGWQAGIDGQSPVQQGLSGRLGIVLGATELGLTGTLALPAVVETELAQLEIARHSLMGLLGLRVATGRTGRITAGIRGGALLFARRTKAPDALVDATPNKLTPSFAVGPEVRLAFIPADVGVSLAVGVDFVPSPPLFAFRSADGLTATRKPWHFEPHASLNLELGR